MLTLALSAAALFQSQVEPVCIVENMTLVAFESGSTALSRSVRIELDNWSRVIRAQQFPPQIQLTGQTDRVGSRRQNQWLSLRRAGAVRNYLVGNGVPRGLIAVSATGEERPIVDTDDGVPEAQNRVVWLQMIPDPREPPPRCPARNDHPAR